MHRLLRDIAAGVQTLRFLTALVCSAAVTTAVAGPMAYQALSFDPPASVLGTASSANRASAPGPTGSVSRPPSTTGAPSTVATTATTVPPTTAAPTTAPPPSLAAATTTTVVPPRVPASVVTVPQTFPTAPLTTDAPPAVTAPPSTLPETTSPTVVAPPSTAPRPAVGFEITVICEDGKAVELDEQQTGQCADEAER